MGRGPHAGDGVAGRVLIPRRFNGPPASANGGYTCGLIARYVGGPADVSLRSPPPLDTALELERTDEGKLRLWHREVLVAEGSAADPPDVEPPVRPTVAQAREAQRRHPWLDRGGRHPFNACYVCGATRHDGLGNDDLRRLAQETVRALGTGVVALAGTGPDGVKAGIAVAVSKDLVAKGVTADAIARPAAKALGGGVGKGADAVVGGGPNSEGIEEALRLVHEQRAAWEQ